MLTIGERIKEERERLELTQSGLAAAGGVSKTSQINYEGGKRSPDADYLAAVARAGVDVQYVLTGIPATPVEGDSAEMLLRYRKASPELRAALLAAAGAVLAPSPPTAPRVQISGGEQAQVIAGEVRQKGMTINVGRQKGGKKK